MDKQSKIILISGPTASGKSNFAVKIAKKIQGEIINADSMQVYKKLKILTARPNKIEQKNIKHHLYGVVDLNKKFSTGEWLKIAIKKNIITLLKKMMISGEKKEKEFLGSSLIKKLKILNTAKQMLKLNGFMTGN